MNGLPLGDRMSTRFRASGPATEGKERTMKLHRTTLLLLILLGMSLTGVQAPAVPPAPTLAVAIVDGNSSEWDLTNDFFTNMHRGGKVTKPIESKAYLRYDCAAQTAYVLVLAEPGVPGLVGAYGGTSWVAINTIINKVVSDGSGNDGTPPDFAWVGRGYDGNQTHARGYEASFHLTPGDYGIILHMDVRDSGATQTSATPGFPGSAPALRILCQPVTGTESMSWTRVKGLYR
jgi:hypothetical protein